MLIIMGPERSVSTNVRVTRDEQPETLSTTELVCSICMASPTDPVLTSCGHLFCWPCLYRWLQAQPKPCPVCRTMLRTDVNITPIYASHGSSHVASDSAIPPRPNPPASSAEVPSGRDEFDGIVLERVRESLVRAELVERLNAIQMERHELLTDLIEVRRERTQLRQNVNAVLQQNTILVREAEERVLLYLGMVREAGERERRHLLERNRMEERIATLVTRDNRPVQQTVNYDLMRRNVVLTRQVEERDQRQLELVREAEEREQRHFELTSRLEQRIAILESLVATAGWPRGQEVSLIWILNPSYGL